MGSVGVRADDGGVQQAGPEHAHCCAEGGIAQCVMMAVCMQDMGANGHDDDDAAGRRSQHANTFAGREHALLTGGELVGG